MWYWSFSLHLVFLGAFWCFWSFLPCCLLDLWLFLVLPLPFRTGVPLSGCFTSFDLFLPQDSIAVTVERRPCISGFSFFSPINVLSVFCYVFVFVFCVFFVFVFLDGQESSRSFSSNVMIITFTFLVKKNIKITHAKIEKKYKNNK